MDKKAFKVTDTSRTGLYGVVASNLKELVRQGCNKLKLSEDGCRVCLFEDGTEVDESYFLTLDRDCKLVILQKGQEWKEEKYTILDRFMETFYENNDELATLANYVSSPKKRKFLENFIPQYEENISAEKREDDPAWFKGLNERFKTKSDYMKFNCGHRMRNYLSKGGIPKDFDQQMKADCSEFIAKILKMLKKNKYNESYFDRKDAQNQRICDSNGLFTCQGPFDKQTCGSNHSINPYGCREYRLTFRSWNLDHKKERSVIISDIAEAVKNKETDDTKVLHFYEDLFTMKNLKFVFIVCHEITRHNL